MADPIRLYRPSNGTEGECFAEDYCYRCIANDIAPCPILLNTMAYQTTDAEYPREWTFDESGEPVCTAFERGGRDHG